jgi:galactokinase
MKEKARQLFHQHFAGEAVIVRSPGRVNLIGEHTDYNMGFVLPAAVQQAVYLAIQSRNDNEIHLIAGDFNEKFETNIASLQKTKQRWPDYIIGVVDQLLKNHYPVGGFNAALYGDIPIGAGMSSSAAVECATVFALNELFHLNLSKIEMIKLAQKAENEFVGVKCGIMDQFASMMGTRGSVIRLDCRSLEFEYVPFLHENINIVLFDTGVKHDLAASEYNTRRRECETGVSVIAKKYPVVQSLRDATVEMVYECLEGGEGKVYERCLYVTEEIKRLNDACEDLKRNDAAAFGKKMYATHDGLTRLYEVSCPELDFLVDCAKQEKNILGARLMGGGFGGCTINLIRKEAIDIVVKRIEEKYFGRFKRPMQHYISVLSDGTGIL